MCGEFKSKVQSPISNFQFPILNSQVQFSVTKQKLKAQCYDILYLVLQLSSCKLRASNFIAKSNDLVLQVKIPIPYP